MRKLNKASALVGAVALLMLAVTAVSVTARVTSAGGSSDDDAGEQQVAAGTIDDGAELLSQASITLEQAIAAAQGAAQGAVGEVDLEEYKGKLAFNVDIGDSDVKVDAATGEVLGVGTD